MKKKFTYILLPLALIGIFLTLHSREVHALEIRAEFSPQQLQLESYGQLKVTVTGARKAEIHVPEIDGLTIQARGSMQSMHVINGDTTISYTANYLVVPQHEGHFTLEPITATVKGETVTAEAVQIDVSGTGAPATQNRSLSTDDTKPDSELAFLQFIPQKTRLFVGEKIPFQLKAYFKHDARELTLPVLNGDGFTVAPFSQNPKQEQEVYNNEYYNVLTWNNSLSGVKSGTFSLQFNLDGTLVLRRQQQESDPFNNMDPFFNDFFARSRYQQVPVQLKSDPAKLTVMPLPLDQQPSDFSGAVGQFSLSASATPMDLSPGEPLTLKLVVSGNGNFDRVQCPDFPDTANFKVYQADESNTNSEKGKVFERAVVPKNRMATTIPPHSLTYFDPVEEQYVTTTSQAITLSLGSAATTEQAASTAHTAGGSDSAASKHVEPEKPASKPLLLDNLAPQKLTTGPFNQAIHPLHKQVWFLAVFLLLALCLAALLFLAARRGYAQRHPERIIKKHCHQQKLQHIQAISDARQSADASRIMDSCRTALQHQAELLTGVSASAVTAASLAAQQGKSISTSLISLLQIAEEYVYGGALRQYSNENEYAAAVEKELENIS